MDGNYDDVVLICIVWVVLMCVMVVCRFRLFVSVVLISWLRIGLWKLCYYVLVLVVGLLVVRFVFVKVVVSGGGVMVVIGVFV